MLKLRMYHLIANVAPKAENHVNPFLFYGSSIVVGLILGVLMILWIEH